MVENKAKVFTPPAALPQRYQSQGGSVGSSGASAGAGAPHPPRAERPRAARTVQGLARAGRGPAAILRSRCHLPTS